VEKGKEKVIKKSSNAKARNRELEYDESDES
jgi:hypothetical protein